MGRRALPAAHHVRDRLRRRGLRDRRPDRPPRARRSTSSRSTPACSSPRPMRSGAGSRSATASTIRAVRPAETVEEQAADHGERLWEREPDRCCALRKVVPLRRALAGADAWVTRHPARADARPRARRASSSGTSASALVKVNPLAGWTNADVWAYLREHDVPVSPLHAQGYPEHRLLPARAAVAAGEDPRAGRWRGRAKTECGLHARPQNRPFRCTSTRAKEPRAMSMTVAETTSFRPHGGALVDRFVAGRRGRGAARARAARLPRDHARRARAGRPRADRDGRRQPADRLPGPGRLRERRRHACGSPTARSGRCRSRSPSPTTTRRSSAGRRGGAPRRRAAGSGA